MTQFQYDVILKIIEDGAPVLFNELGNAIHSLIIDNNKLKQENEELQAKLKAITDSEVAAVPIVENDNKKVKKK